jgi:hypothetical protein
MYCTLRIHLKDFVNFIRCLSRKIKGGHFAKDLALFCSILCVAATWDFFETKGYRFNVSIDDSASDVGNNTHTIELVDISLSIDDEENETET